MYYDENQNTRGPFTCKKESECTGSFLIRFVQIYITEKEKTISNIF